MASVRAATALTWAGNTNYTLTTNTQVANTDPYYFNVEDYQATLGVWVNYASAPIASDGPSLYAALIPGDILGVGSNSADTQEHALYFRDLGAARPDIFVLPLNIMANGIVVYIYAPRAGANNVTVRAMINVHRAV